MQIQLFTYQQENTFSNLTVLAIDGEPWFVAKEICEILEIPGRVRDALRVLDSDEKGARQMRTLGGMQEVSIISQSGLYSLVFRSQTPGAKKFRKWVTSVVIPSILKKGSYSISEKERCLEISHGVLPIAEAEGTTLFVSGRALHELLEIEEDFSMWMQDCITQYGFVKNVDFVIGEERPDYGNLLEEAAPQNVSVRSGNEIVKNAADYFVSVDMAKELAMESNNEKGKAIQRYFIQCEKQIVKRLRQARTSQLLSINKKDIALKRAVDEVDHQTRLAQHYHDEACLYKNKVEYANQQTNAALMLTLETKVELEANRKIFQEAEIMRAIMTSPDKACLTDSATLSVMLERAMNNIDDRCSPATCDGKVMKQTKNEKIDHEASHKAIKAFQSIGRMKGKNRTTH